MEKETGRGERNENRHVIHDVKVVGATNMAASPSRDKTKSKYKDLYGKKTYRFCNLGK